MDVIQEVGFCRVGSYLLCRATRVYQVTKKLLKFSGCETEVELILARSASLFSNTAEHPGNEQMSLAP